MLDTSIYTKCDICGKVIREDDKFYDPQNEQLVCGQCYNNYVVPANYERLAENETNRPSWKELFFGIAKLVSQRSKDPHTKVGAVLVKDNRVIGIGYNGEPKGFRLRFDWSSKEKYDYVIHAELNAIANANSIGANVRGADIYLTLSPCHDCMKLLIQHEIHAIYYINDYTDIELTKKIAENANIILKKENENENN